MAESIHDVLTRIIRDNDADVARIPLTNGMHLKVDADYERGYIDGLNAATQRMKAAMLGTQILERAERMRAPAYAGPIIDVDPQ